MWMEEEQQFLYAEFIGSGLQARHFSTLELKVC